MYRIGIIGTENSHALAFSREINLPDPGTGERKYPDAKVVGVYGPDEQSARQIIEETGAEFLAAEPADFHGKVDAMIITNRKGSLHRQYAQPFVEKGMPVFVDKPFTADTEEAKALVAAAKQGGAPICGGSGCKHAYDVLTLQHKVRQLGKDLVSASMNFAADPASEYDGFYFYSPHLTEMALAIFGEDVRSVLALEKEGSRIAVWRYDRYDISLHYTKGTQQTGCILYAQTGVLAREIDISMIYAQEVAHFMEMLRSGNMPGSYGGLIRPVQLIAAVEESVKTSKEIPVPPIDG